MTKRKNKAAPAGVTDDGAAGPEKVGTSGLDLEDVLAQIGEDQNAIILIHKEAADGSGRMDYVCKVTAATLNLDQIRKQYGGGKYVLRSRNAQTQRWGLSKTFGLAAPLDAGLSGGPAGGLTSDFQQTLLLKLLEQRTAPSDPMAIALQIAALVKQPDPMELAVKLAGIMKGGGDGNGIDALLKGVDLAKKLNGGDGDGDSTVWSAVKELGPGVLDVLGKVAEGRAAPAPTAPALAAVVPPAQIAPAAPAVETETVPLSPYMRALKQLVPQLMLWAEKGKDPEQCADWVLSEATDMAQEVTATEAVKPDFAARIFTAFPELAPQREWVQRFLDAIIEWATPEEEPEPPAPKNNGVDME